MMKLLLFFLSPQVPSTSKTLTGKAKLKKINLLVCVLSGGNSICQNCTLGSGGHERDGMAAGVISLVPRRVARL